MMVIPIPARNLAKPTYHHRERSSLVGLEMTVRCEHRDENPDKLIIVTIKL